MEDKLTPEFEDAIKEIVAMCQAGGERRVNKAEMRRTIWLCLRKVRKAGIKQGKEEAFRTLKGSIRGNT